MTDLIFLPIHSEWVILEYYIIKFMGTYLVMFHILNNVHVHVLYLTVIVFNMIPIGLNVLSHRVNICIIRLNCHTVIGTLSWCVE